MFRKDNQLLCLNADNTFMDFHIDKLISQTFWNIKDAFHE